MSTDTLLGSFTAGETRVDIHRGWSNFDGIVHRFVQANTCQEIAVSSHRGLDIADSTGFDQAELKAGLRKVLGRS